MKLRGPIALALALVALHATTPSAAGAAANLLANPGFESGLSGWTCSATSGAQAVSSPVHGGAGARACLWL
ncbi:hypothetical protein [Nonomuraea sp. NPDC049784]|uniref:hypothetical protein n=1 Tax=Nonomuraea sp. NPDC049784 TaxID=3154361 RepID=UPI0033D10624